MPVFDADAYARTLEPPVLTVAGRTFTGRHLSAAQWTRAMALLDRAQVTGSLYAYADVARAVFGAMFPHPWWKVWARRPVDLILAQPPAVWQQALTAFFASPTTPAATVTKATPAGSPSLYVSADGSASSSPPTASTATTPPAAGAPATA